MGLIEICYEDMNWLEWQNSGGKVSALTLFRCMKRSKYRPCTAHWWWQSAILSHAWRGSQDVDKCGHCHVLQYRISQHSPSIHWDTGGVCW